MRPQATRPIWRPLAQGVRQAASASWKRHQSHRASPSGGGSKLLYAATGIAAGGMTATLLLGGGLQATPKAEVDAQTQTRQKRQYASREDTLKVTHCHTSPQQFEAMVLNLICSGPRGDTCPSRPRRRQHRLRRPRRARPLRMVNLPHDIPSRRHCPTHEHRRRLVCRQGVREEQHPHGPLWRRIQRRG